MILCTGRVYQHFKGKLYLVTGVSHDSINDCTVVEYTALYGMCKRYTREMKEFLSHLDKHGNSISVRNDNVTGQIHCFELVGEEDEICIKKANK